MAVKSNPISKNLEFNTHIDQVAKEFDFLISDFGFALSKNEFVGREFWIVYSKDHVDIEILFQTGSLPYVTLRNNHMPHDEEHYIDNGDSVEEFSVRAQEIKNSRYQRRDPKEKRAMDELSSISTSALKELTDDYSLFGRSEHLEYLKVAALTVRENIEFRKGNMSRHSMS